jgi:hypothetical protein
MLGQQVSGMPQGHSLFHDGRISLTRQAYVYARRFSVTRLVVNTPPPCLSWATHEPKRGPIPRAVTVAATRPDRRKQFGPRGWQSFYRQNHGRAVTLSCKRSGWRQRQTI